MYVQKSTNKLIIKSMQKYKKINMQLQKILKKINYKTKNFKKKKKIII